MRFFSDLRGDFSEYILSANKKSGVVFANSLKSILGSGGIGGIGILAKENLEVFIASQCFSVHLVSRTVSDVAKAFGIGCVYEKSSSMLVSLPFPSLVWKQIQGEREMGNDFPSRATRQASPSGRFSIALISIGRGTEPSIAQICFPDRARTVFGQKNENPQ